MSEQVGEIKKSASYTTRRVIAYIVLTFLAILCLFWFYILFVYATRTNSAIQSGISFIPSSHFIENLTNVANDSSYPMIRGLLNSFIVAGITALLSVYFSTLTAYAIHVYDFKGKTIIFTGILMIMMIPSQVTVLGFLRWISTLQDFNKSVVTGITDWGIFGEAFTTGLRKIARGGTYADYIWLTVPSIAAPITFYYLKQYMESALPLALVEAARIDGSSEIRTFNHIALPLMKPALSVQAIFTFVSSWNNYFVPSHILTDDSSLKTIPILIAELRSADYAKFDMGKVYMSIFVSIFPVIIVYLILSRNIVGGVALGSVKG